MQQWVVHQKQKVQQQNKMLQNQKKMQKKMLQNQKKVQQQQKQKMLQNPKKKMLQHSQLQHYWAETSASWRRQSQGVGVARVQAAKEGEARWGKQGGSFNLQILMKLPRRF